MSKKWDCEVYYLKGHRVYGIEAETEEAARKIAIQDLTANIGYDTLVEDVYVEEESK
tara:strand:+ start:159 stop:329 length:171 start_codon:yes stop_codon:yes gene_type:complete